FSFELNIISKTLNDALHIVEMILPSFDPDYTVDVQFIDDFDHLDRIPVIYNGIEHQDTYEGSFTQTRSIVWTLRFTVKSWLYGPLETIAPIKKIDLRFHGDFDAT